MTPRRFAPVLTLVTLLAACGDSPLSPPPPSQCLVEVSQSSSNPPSTGSSPAGSPLHALVDDFAGASVNSQRWEPYDPTTAELTAQDDRLVVSVRPGATDYSGVSYRQPHTLVGSSFFAEVSQAASGGSLVETVVGIHTPDDVEFVLLTSYGDRLEAVYNWRDRGCNDPAHRRTAWGLEYCLLGSVAFDAAAHRFRRLREQGGTLHLELSSDGETWSQPDGWSLTHHFADPTALHGLLAAGTPREYEATAAAHFENVNTSVPAIPRGLDASCATPTAPEVRLSWERRSVNELGYRIERRAGSGAFAEIGTVGAGVLEFVDAQTRGRTTYEYRVRAANATGHSAYSRTVRVAR